MASKKHKIEKDLWHDHVNKLKHFGVAKRIEESLDIGVADVVYGLRWLAEPTRAGWLELKRRQMWPTRSTTKVWLPHFTVDQATFLETWGKVGVGAFLLAHIEYDFLLFPWTAARDIQAGVNTSTMFSLAVVHGQYDFPLRDILRALTKWPT